LKVERESQRRVAELKREAQRDISAGGKREVLDKGISSSGRDVRVMREGLVVKKRRMSTTLQPRTNLRPFKAARFCRATR
jgi:hypothetical protein